MSESTSSDGASFPSLLLLLFIGLKLGNVIDWSWWWVMSPLWISILVALFVLLIISIAAHMQNIITLFSIYKSKIKNKK